MRTILAIAAKDLKLITRDWLGLFFIIGFPILIGVFFGSMYPSGGAERAKLTVAVVDEDNSPMSARFLEALTEGGNVQVEKLPRSEATDRVRRGQLVGLIALPKGFGESAGILWMDGPAIEMGIDPSRGAESAMLQGMIMKAVSRLMMVRFQDPASMRPLVTQAADDIAADDEIPTALKPLLARMMESLDRLLESWSQVQAEEQAESNDEGADADGETNDEPDFQLARIETIDVTREIAAGSTEALVRQLRSRWDISFPQAMLWGVLACAASFAVTIVKEKKQGTFLRLQVAPVTRAHVFTGKAAACFFAVLGVIAVLVVLGVALGMRPRSPWLLVLAAVSVAICFVGIMMLMSVSGKSEEGVSGAAWGANMFMAMFGGAMVPLLFMPPFMRALSDLSPVKWSILALEGAIWRGFTFREMLLPCMVLAAVGLVTMAIGIAVLSRRTN